jgi:hypothetical protein
MAANQQNLGKKLGTYSPSLPSEGINTANTLVSYIHPPEL